MSQRSSSSDPQRSREETTDVPPNADWLQRMAEIEGRHPPVSAAGFYFGVGRLCEEATAATPLATNVAEPATGWSASAVDRELFDPDSGTYEAELAALCAKVEALVEVLCQLLPGGAALAADSLLAAIQQFTDHRAGIVASAVELSVGDLDVARHLVSQRVCVAAMQELGRRLDPHPQATIARSTPMDGSAADPSKAGSLRMREQLDELENALSRLIQLAAQGCSHANIAALIAGTTHSSSPLARENGNDLSIDERLERAYDAWQHDSSASVATSQPECHQVVVAHDGRVRTMQLEVQGLQWRANGRLHGTFVQPPATALADVTYGLVRLRGRAGEDRVFVVAEPFALHWHDRPEGRTAAFTAYLGPRPGKAREPVHLPATAVQFVFAD